MKSQFFIVLALVMVAGVGGAMAQSECENTRYIEVRGSASTTIEPNRIQVNITLSEADSKGKVTLSELESNLASALKLSDVDAKTLVVTGQSSTADKRNNAFQYKSYQLTLTSATQVATLFDAFAQKGVANAWLGRIYSDKQSEVEGQVKAQAVQNARKSAEIIALALNQKMGEAIWVQDFSSPQMYDEVSFLGTRAMKSGENVSLPTDLQMRPITIQQSLSIRFLLLVTPSGAATPTF